MGNFDGVVGALGNVGRALPFLFFSKLSGGELGFVFCFWKVNGFDFDDRIRDGVLGVLVDDGNGGAGASSII